MLLPLLIGIAAPTSAQDLERQEIVVTGSRIDQDDYLDFQPAVGLRRKADFLVQQVTIRGDTRDPKQRVAEIRAMLRKAIELGPKGGIELAQGEYVITQLTLGNAEDLELEDDRRPDSQRIDFLIKASLAGRTVEQAQAAIAKFIEDVPEVGRAQMEEMGDATLSVIGPDSYRPAVIAAVVEDAKRQSALMGEGYGVELTGLNMPVQWARSSPGEVLLFIPYELKVRPR